MVQMENLVTYRSAGANTIDLVSNGLHTSTTVLQYEFMQKYWIIVRTDSFVRYPTIPPKVFIC